MSIWYALNYKQTTTGKLPERLG